MPPNIDDKKTDADTSTEKPEGLVGTPEEVKNYKRKLLENDLLKAEQDGDLLKANRIRTMLQVGGSREFFKLLFSDPLKAEKILKANLSDTSQDILSAQQPNSCPNRLLQGIRINIFQTDLCLNQSLLTEERNSDNQEQVAQSLEKESSETQDDLLKTIAEGTGGHYIYDPSGNIDSYLENLSILFESVYPTTDDQRDLLGIDSLWQFTNQQEFSSDLTKRFALWHLEQVNINLASGRKQIAKFMIDRYIAVIESEVKKGFDLYQASYMIKSARKISEDIE